MILASIGILESVQHLTYTVGEYVPSLGGIVAYILQPGDPGYSATVQRGLIINDTGEDVATWRPNSSIATSTAFGTGNANTDLMYAADSTTPDSVAVLAHNYVNLGFDDWYAPSLNELRKVYLNKLALPISYLKQWTSSQSGAGGAWVIDFLDGSETTEPKGNYNKLVYFRSF